MCVNFLREREREIISGIKIRKDSNFLYYTILKDYCLFRNLEFLLLES